MTDSYRGVPAAPGVAAGTAVVIGRAVDRGPRDGEALVRADGGSTSGPQRVASSVEEALDAVAMELSALADRLRVSGHPEEADIVSVGALIARDPVLREDAQGEWQRGADPAEAVLAAADRHAAAIQSLGDATLRERAADVRQVGRRAAAFLRGAAPAAAEEPVILVADELGPAEIMGLDGGAVAGGVAVRGGPNSHAAIVARSLRIPLVLGVPAEILLVAEGAPVLVDGSAGIVTVEPGQPELRAVQAAMDRAVSRREALAGERGLPCVTIDGHSVSLLCNVSTRAETIAGLEAGAEGVGLLRTELPFLESGRWPSEAEHRAALEPILSLLEGRVATVRVLDFGGDKVPPFLADAMSEVPGIGARGLPALLTTPGALQSQLRAALDAGRNSRLRILVPMVTSLREVRLAREALEEAAADEGAEKPDIGVMVEVPSAALIADRLAQEVDFISIGTNDLTQHVLGVSRRDPSARPSLAAHPSLLALINRVVRSGAAHGRTVGVCGEAGGDPLVLPLLVGIGVGALSVSPAMVDEVRSQVRSLSFESCQAAVREALAMDSVEEVWALVAERFPRDAP